MPTRTPNRSHPRGGPRARVAFVAIALSLSLAAAFALGVARRSGEGSRAPADLPMGLTHGSGSAALASAEAAARGVGPGVEQRPAAADPAPLLVRSLVVELLEGAGPPLEGARLREMIDCALDPARPLAERLRAADWLARFGSDEAVRALERLLQSDPPAPLALAAASGLASHPTGHEILVRLLESDDDGLFLASLRALALSGDAGARDRLCALAVDAGLSPALRAEALAALADVPGPQALAALEQAFRSSEDDGVVSSSLASLAERDFAETGGFFRSVVGAAEQPLALRIAALEALSIAGSPGAADLLLEVATRAEEPDLRAAAIEAIGLRVDPDVDTGIGSLVGLLDVEAAGTVRAAAYDTLAFHARAARTGSDPDVLLARALAETDPIVKLHAYRFVGSLLHAGDDPRLAAGFDATMAAWLRDEASQGESAWARRLSIDALALAGTPGAWRALRSLARSDDPAVSERAEKGLGLLARTRGNDPETGEEG